MKLETQDAENLHKRRESLKNEIKSYQNSFLDESTSLIKSTLSVERECPICLSSQNSVDLFVKNGAIHAYCRECAMVYTRNILNPNELRNYYINMPHLQNCFAEAESDFYIKIYNHGLENIINNLSMKTAIKDNIKLLDIGSSSGVFLECAKRSGLNKLTGIELNDDDREIAVSKGFKIYSNSIKEINETFDVITLWDVFEHIPDGIDFLETLKNKLSDNGLVFMQIPSCESLAARILREKCNIFDGLEHLNLYSEYAIRKLTSICGFEVVHIEDVISEEYPTLNFLNYEDPYTPGYKVKKLSQPYFLDQKCIINSGMGYKKQIILKSL